MYTSKVMLSIPVSHAQGAKLDKQSLHMVRSVTCCKMTEMSKSTYSAMCEVLQNDMKVQVCMLYNVFQNILRITKKVA